MCVYRKFHFELAQSWQRDIRYPYVGTQSACHSRRSLSHGAAAQYQHLRAVYSRHTADELSLAALGLLQIVSTVQRSHASCHLAHRDKQR